MQTFRGDAIYDASPRAFFLLQKPLCSEKNAAYTETEFLLGVNRNHACAVVVAIYVPLGTATLCRQKECKRFAYSISTPGTLHNT